MTNSLKLDFLDLSSIKKYKKKNFKNLSPIEIINKLVENGIKIDSGSDSKLLIEIIDDIIFDYEDEYFEKPDEIKKINKRKYKKERKFDIINLLEKYKRLDLYNLTIEEKKNKIKFLILIDNKTGVFSIYVGDSNYRRYCGYITFTTSPYKVENNILKKENFVNIKYNYAYIEWIKPKEKCNVLLNGTQILNTFINLCYLLNIDRVDLQDASDINCVYKHQNLKNSLKYYKLIQEGKTWYEKNKFLPSPEKRIRKNFDRQILNSHLPPLSYSDNNIEGKLSYKNFYSNYKNSIKLLNNFDMLCINNISNIIENNVLLKRRIFNDYNIPRNFYYELIKLSDKIENVSNNTNNFPLKNYVKKINEKDCKYFNDFQKLFIDNSDFIDVLNYICLEYSNWFNLDILNEVEELEKSLNNLNDVNYYFLILK